MPAEGKLFMQARSRADGASIASQEANGHLHWKTAGERTCRASRKLCRSALDRACCCVAQVRALARGPPESNRQLPASKQQKRHALPTPTAPARVCSGCAGKLHSTGARSTAGDCCVCWEIRGTGALPACFDWKGHLPKVTWSWNLNLIS